MAGKKGQIKGLEEDIRRHRLMYYNEQPELRDAEFDALVVKARGQDFEGQKESYAEIQRILIEEVPVIKPAFLPVLYGVRNNLRGVAPHPMGWALLQDAWFAD